MPRLSRLCVLAVLTAVLTGCPPAVHVILFNQTAESLVVVVWGNEYPVAARESGRFPLSETITVRSSKGRYEYVFPAALRYDHPGPYIEFRFPGGEMVKMEIRADYAIYILPVAAPAPGPTPYPQREGFPVRPRAS